MTIKIANIVLILKKSNINIRTVKMALKCVCVFLFVFELQQVVH